MLAALAAQQQTVRNLQVQAPPVYAPNHQTPLPFTPEQITQALGQYIQGPSGKFEVIPDSQAALWAQALGAAKAAGAPE